MTLNEVRNAILNWKMQNAQMQLEFFGKVLDTLKVENGVCTAEQLTTLEGVMWNITENFCWAVIHTPHGAAVVSANNVWTFASSQDVGKFARERDNVDGLHALVQPAESLTIFRQDYASGIFCDMLWEIMHANRWNDPSYNWREIIDNTLTECKSILRDALTEIAEANAEATE